MTNDDRSSARAAAGGWRALRRGAALLAVIAAGGLAGSGSAADAASARAAVAVEAAQAARATTPNGTGGVNAPETLGKPYLVLVSFDGFRPDYLDRYETPSFDRVAARGVAAEALVSVYPSNRLRNSCGLPLGEPSILLMSAHWPWSADWMPALEDRRHAENWK